MDRYSSQPVLTVTCDVFVLSYQETAKINNQRNSKSSSYV